MKTRVVYAPMEIASCENMRLSRPYGDCMCTYITVLIFIKIFIIHFNLLNPWLSAKTGILCKLVIFVLAHTLFKPNGTKLQWSYGSLQMDVYPSFCLSSMLNNFFDFFSLSDGLMDLNLDVSLRCMEPFLIFL